VTASAIGFAGLTHLGLCSAVTAASKGFRVVGYDSDSARVKEIAEGRWPVLEPGLIELAGAHGARLAWRDDIGALGLCDVVYIASDVPTDECGRSDLSGIMALIERVTAVLKQEAVLVVLCQVPPGFTRGLAFPPARLYYQVETLVFGRAIERALNPERFIIGCADATALLPPAFADFLSAFGCPILPMRYESAELAKISINCCLVASISVANTMAELCEKIGADWSEIVPALKLDQRIGQHAYLAPGLGLAGGNLERDLATVLRLAENTGSDSGVIESFVRNSRHCRDWALRTLHRHVFALRPDAALGILGLAYKENTHSTKNSPALALMAHLRHCRVQVYDPVVPLGAVGQPNAVGAKSALDAARGMDALLIMTPWPEFKKLNPAEIANVLRGRAVIDPYRVLNGTAVATAGLEYFTLGAEPLWGMARKAPVPSPLEGDEASRNA
jgi:UDPglucose 6-dehydrogenase